MKKMQTKNIAKMIAAVHAKKRSQQIAFQDHNVEDNQDLAIREVTFEFDFRVKTTWVEVTKNPNNAGELKANIVGRGSRQVRVAGFRAKPGQQFSYRVFAASF